MCARTRLVLLALMAILAPGATQAGGFLELAPLASTHQDLLRAWEADPVAAICFLFCAQVVLAALAVPGSAVLLLAAGATCGLLGGTLLCLTACTLGAVLTMLVSRRFLRRAVARRFGSRLAELDAGFAREGAFYLFSLRTLPVIPFPLVNLLVGLTGMRAWTFAWVSFAGMFAGTLVYVYAGVQLGRIASPDDLFSPALLAAFAAIGLLPLLGRRLLAGSIALRASPVSGR